MKQRCRSLWQSSFLYRFKYHDLLRRRSFIVFLAPTFEVNLARQSVHVQLTTLDDTFLKDDDSMEKKRAGVKNKKAVEIGGGSRITASTRSSHRIVIATWPRRLPTVHEEHDAPKFTTTPSYLHFTTIGAGGV